MRSIYTVGRRVIWKLPGRPDRKGTVRQIVDRNHVLVEYDDGDGRLFSVNTKSPFLTHLSVLDQLADL